jgi:hypothetical chaperone protein
MPACGLDFGTSNTTLGDASHGAPRLAALEGEHVTIPSAIFFGWSGEPSFGRAAMEAYVEGVPGRLMRSLKSVLGTSLADETTAVGRRRLRFRDVIAVYLREVKRRAEARSGVAFDSVVHGRPVHFVDGNPEGDRAAEDMLRDIAHDVGFRNVSFQYEPIAAALDYERQITREEIALIADIGGGTSDFSIIRLSPERHRKVERADDILANDGVRVGGVDFDRVLSLARLMPLLGYGSPTTRAGRDVPGGVFHDLATWSNINRLYNDKTQRELRAIRRDALRPELMNRMSLVLDREMGHTLAMDIEATKIALSEREDATIDLAAIEVGLDLSITRDEFAHDTARLAGRIGERIDACLRMAGLKKDAVTSLFLTGGSTRILHVAQAITSLMPQARIVEGDTFGAVGAGLTIEAARRYA